MNLGIATRVTLIDCLREKQDSGWTRFVQLYGPYVKHWALRVGTPFQDCDDVCQDVYRVVVDRIEGFELGERTGSFRKWIQQITRNVCYEHSRRHGPSSGQGGTQALIELQGIASIESCEDDSPDIVVDLYRRAVELAKPEFSQRDWSIVESLVQGSLTTNEIAAQFGLSAAAVRQIKSRIFRRIRAELGDIPAEPSPS